MALIGVRQGDVVRQAGKLQGQPNGAEIIRT
jgi:hypothetical protein